MVFLLAAVLEVSVVTGAYSLPGTVTIPELARYALAS